MLSTLTAHTTKCRGLYMGSSPKDVPENTLISKKYPTPNSVKNALQ